MSTPTQAAPKRHTLRTLLSLAVLIGIVVAVKNAIADKGGSYAAPTAPTVVPPAAPAAATSQPASRPAAVATPVPDSAPAGTPPGATPIKKVATAEEIAGAHPKEKPDEFAVPVEPTQPISGSAGQTNPASRH
jgi:hypothetical protein